MNEARKQPEITLKTLQVYNYLQGRSPAKLEDVAKALDVRKSTAHYHLRKLEELGFVKSEGAGSRTTVYAVRNAIPLEALRLYRAVMRKEIPKYVILCAFFLSLFFMLLFARMPLDLGGVVAYLATISAFVFFLNELRKYL